MPFLGYRPHYEQGHKLAVLDRQGRDVHGHHCTSSRREPGAREKLLSEKP